PSGRRESLKSVPARDPGPATTIDCPSGVSAHPSEGCGPWAVGRRGVARVPGARGARHPAH
ncbi:hypothetical protein AB0919_39375, partial [Streptomyces sp. NPDC046994]|uniref:hypothetical protein n=1 Tax=Streptomyces sp. NPDC046994 TaxID=3155735 RepID=UPI0034526F34